MARGKFITFEGGEGSGKSTQARRLAEHLQSHGIEVILTREPGGSPFAESVRNLILDPATPAHPALAEALLFYAARADHVATVIRPALAAGRWVVSDRFSDSTRVYQGHAGTVALESIAALDWMVVGSDAPDLTFIVDIAPDIGLRRAHERRTAKSRMASEADPYERRDLAFHQKLREGFLAIARAEPNRCRVIDGAQSEDAVANDVLRAVQDQLVVKVS